MSRHPNKAGSSQFHKCITTSPPIALKTAIARIASGAMKSHFFFIVYSSFPQELVVDAPQASPQMKYRVALARK